MSSRTTTLRPLQLFTSDQTTFNDDTLRISRVYTLDETCQFDTSLGEDYTSIPETSNTSYADSPLGKAGIPKEHWRSIIEKINSVLAELDRPSGLNTLEILFDCLTCYIFEAFGRKSRLKRGLQGIRDYVEEENRTTFKPKGLKMTDPAETAWQFLEITKIS